jgi:putative oxidoreductase
MPLAFTTDAATLSAGLLLARLVLGLAMAAHGAQKLFGWFGGHGLAGTAGFFGSLGFRPARLFATAAAVTEVGSGLLVALGLLGPVGPALMISLMIVAMLAVHAKAGFFAQSGGIELALLYAVGAFALALTGPGAYSLDALLGLDALTSSAVAVTAVVAGVLGGEVELLLRRPAPALSGD